MSGAVVRLRAVARLPSIWSFAAALLTFAVSTAIHPDGAGGTLRSALAFGTFNVVVGLAQMFVVTLGPGNVDLSIPSTIALSGFVAMRVMNGADAMILPGILAALASGFAVGIGNTVLIFALRIPPIIATLSASFVIQSVAIVIGGGLLVQPPPGLAAFTGAAPLDLPLIALVGLVLAVASRVVLARTVTGRSVLAIGQNARAARLAGLPVTAVRISIYALSGVLAAVCGTLLASFTGGASLDMGSEYLLASIAVVVIGGTAVAGGRASVSGVWGAALFLVLLVTLLNTFGFGAGGRTLLTGLIIIGVIVAAGGKQAA